MTPTPDKEAAGLEAMSADWREHLTDDEAARVAEVEALMAAVKPLREWRRKIEIMARNRSRTARLRKAA
jgi:hypothetical protein